MNRGGADDHEVGTLAGSYSVIVDAGRLGRVFGHHRHRLLELMRQRELRDDFVAASANVTTLDPALRPGEITTERVDKAGLDTVLSNSFGFGGTNASLALSRLHG